MLKLQPKSFFVGQNQVYLPYCHSTNDVAAQLGQEKDFIDGTLIITDFQSGGRGQRGANWESEPGKNLMMSLLLNISFLEIKQQFNLSMCTALSVLKALTFFGVDNLKLKWPNDIYIGEKKCGGILIENSLREGKLRNAVIGIGINMSQETFENNRATSLKKEGAEVSRNDLAEKICEFFEIYFLKLKAGESLKAEYSENLLGINEERFFVVEENKIRGTITGVSELGELEIDSDFPQKKFNIKEVTFCF